MTNRLQKQAEFQLGGVLLVASPTWSDKLFGRSVCMIVHQGSEGTVGIVLNRILETDADGLWKQLAGKEAACKNARVNFGGPMSGPVVAIHDQAELAEYDPGGGVYLAAQVSALQQLVTMESEHQLRIVVGQAGWEPGKLEQQIQDGKWLAVPLKRELVFSPEDEMWARSIRAIGNHFVTEIAGAIPVDDVLLN